MNKELGDYTVFGFTNKPEPLVRQELFQCLGIIPKFTDFGSTGRLFYYSTYAQVAESETEILIKSGLARSHSGALSAQQMLDHSLMSSDFVCEDAIHGNALIAALSKKAPKFAIYKTVMSAPQLYYAATKDGIICSDRVNTIVRLIKNITLNEDILPMHFLFRTVIGASTYFRGVFRMLPGQLMKWKDGDIKLVLARDLQFTDRNIVKRITPQALETLYQLLFHVIEDYDQQASMDRSSAGCLLSGGVDSSLIQYILNQINAGKPTRTFSFLPNASSFAFELDYAQKASQHFHTKHTFIKFSQKEYPELLLETVDHLAYPPLLPSEPGIYSIAKYVQKGDIPIRFYFVGGGAEPSFGYTYAKTIRKLQYFSRIPGFSKLLIGTGQAIKPFTSFGKRLTESGRKVQNIDNPDSIISPLNMYDVYIEPDHVLTSLGETMLMKALADRRNLAKEYMQSDHILEKAAVLDMITDSYDILVERNQIFLSRCQETINPFSDDEVIQMAFRFDPNIRYLKGFTEKYLLKNLLYQKAGLATAWKPKGGAQFFEDFYEWMRTGTLKPLVDDIEVPGFVDRKEFEKAVRKPDIFLWSILVLDLFQKRVLHAQRDGVFDSF